MRSLPESMLPILRFITSCLIGYLFGSSNMALYIAKVKGVDLRAGGSGNLGASNALLLLGKRAALITVIHDMLKTVAAVSLADHLYPGSLLLKYAAGVSSVMGHIFPFYLKFRGGKGFAAYLGLILAFDWKFFVFMVAAVAVITVLFDYIVFGTFSVIMAYPLYLICSGRPDAACIVLTGSACIFWKHRENIARLRSGEEIGLRRGMAMEDRAK